MTKSTKLKQLLSFHNTLPIPEQSTPILLDQHQTLQTYLDKQLTPFQQTKLTKLLELERELTLRENQ